jgi:hypothetical protein
MLSWHQFNGSNFMKKSLVRSALVLLVAQPLVSQAANCEIPAHIVAHLQGTLGTVINEPDANGGIFKPSRMWSAIVDRKGTLCSIIDSGNDPWPGSRAIAIAKAGK